MLYLRKLKIRAEKLTKQKLEEKEKKAGGPSNLIEVKVTNLNNP